MNVDRYAVHCLKQRTNVSLQGSAPEISGFYSSRPNLVSNPNSGQPHVANEWVSPRAIPTVESSERKRVNSAQ